MRRFLLVALALAALAASWTSAASGATPRRTDAYPLHTGKTIRSTSRGPRVTNIQWLLAGHRPSVHRGIRPLAGTSPSGIFGVRTAAAVKSAKYKLGYPLWAITPRVDSAMLAAYLTGKRTRPRSYVATAARRAKAAQLAAAESARAARLVATAKRYIGVAESPMGSNCGRTVQWFQSSTGAYCAAWCASFVQKMLQLIDYGTIAHRSAHVYTIKSYAMYRGWTRSQRAVPGRLVVFNSWQGHIGIVSLVTRAGFWTISGNSSDRVTSRFTYWGARSVTFISLPGVA